MPFDAIDALRTEGGGLLLDIEKSIAQVRLCRPKRSQLKSTQEELHARTTACLAYERKGTELIYQIALEVAADPSSGPLAEAKIASLNAQRETVRRLLETYASEVSELRASHDSRITNFVNATIIVVAVATLFVAKITYDDAKESGQKAQDASVKQDGVINQQLQQLTAVGTTIGKVDTDLGKVDTDLGKVDQDTQQEQGILSSISGSAKTQADYVNAQISAAKKRDEAEVRRATADRFFNAATELKTYYEDLQKRLEDSVYLLRIDAALGGVPFSVGEQMNLQDTGASLQSRAELAGSLQRIAHSLQQMDSQEWPRAVAELSTLQMSAFPDGGTTFTSDVARLKSDVALARDDRALQHPELLEPLVNAVTEFLNHERSTYISLSSLRIKESGILSRDLIERDDVDLTSVINPALAPFGLIANANITKADTESYKKLALPGVYERTQRQIADFNVRTNSILDSWMTLQKELLIREEVINP